MVGDDISHIRGPKPVCPDKMYVVLDLELLEVFVSMGILAPALTTAEVSSRS